MKRLALGSSLRVRIPCRRMHAWADGLSTVGLMAAFAVKHGVGTPRMGLRRPLPSVDLRRTARRQAAPGDFAPRLVFSGEAEEFPVER